MALLSHQFLDDAFVKNCVLMFADLDPTPRGCEDLQPSLPRQLFCDNDSLLAVGIVDLPIKT